MAVELRCPECRAKLRVPVPPDAGDDVECAKCGHTFPAPDLDADDDADARPAKKAKSPFKDDEPRKPAKPKKEKKESEKKATSPKRKKAKKKETNPAVLAGIVIGGLVFIGLVTALLVWFTRRQPAAVEMMHYLPDDTEMATGYNLGHVQKYEKLFEKLDTIMGDAPPRKAFTAFAKALGQDPKEVMDYAVTGTGRANGSMAIVLRTKKEYDTGKLAKFPGAREASANGVKYYTVDRIDGVDFDSPRVFAPTNRLLVICPGTIPKGQFDGMVGGYKDSDKAITARMGPLGNKTTRGTFWVLYVFGTGSKFRPTPPAETKDQPGQGTDSQYQDMVYKLAGKAPGMGYKVSVGSKEIRFEWLVQYEDAEAAKEQAKRWKESEVAKGDDGDIRTVKWWPSLSNRFGQKKAQTEMLNHISFTSSGEVFIARTEVTTTEMTGSLGNLANRAIELMPGATPKGP